MHTLPSYVLVTPARNEAQFIEGAIKSVISQTVRPLRWVIVSDGSTDETDQIVRNYAAEHPWIELLRKEPHADRHFGAKVEAFRAGQSRMEEIPYDVIGNLDADISFDDPCYFEFLMTKMNEDSKLGVCGTSYIEGPTIFPRKLNSTEDVFGACQMFRRQCFEEIGGYEPLPTGGIDVIAVLKAQAKGWRTRTFMEKRCVHHRIVASAHRTGMIARLLETGRKDYILGSHPGFEVFRSIYLMKNRPYIIGGALTLVGYAGAMMHRTRRIIPDELLRIRQRDQLRRLKMVLRLTA